MCKCVCVCACEHVCVCVCVVAGSQSVVLEGNDIRSDSIMKSIAGELIVCV